MLRTPERTGDPEAVSARLEARDDGHGVGQLEACASESDLAGKGGEVSSWHIAEAGLRREAERRVRSVVR